MTAKLAVIASAGPAGLTAGLELARRSGIKPLVFETDAQVGGISRTIAYKGNRIDIGGHRFFSKSDRVMAWWRDLLPLQGAPGGKACALQLNYQNGQRWLAMPADGPDPERVDDVMLVRPRTSRILFRGQLFDYPLSLSLGTLRKLGLITTARVGTSYLRARALPIRPERTLEEFFINRFGHELYATFFRDYTEKVWGVPCNQISAEWGAQRIKGLSLSAALAHALRSLLPKRLDLARKQTETSLIEQFLYPKYGPGQMWEKAARMLTAAGGELHLQTRIVGLRHEGGRIRAVTAVHADGRRQEIDCDYFFSTMPIRELLRSLDPGPPATVGDVSDGLVYRDFGTVGVLLKRLKLGGNSTGRTLAAAMPDNWIYVQEPGVKVGRLQFFNNWSPYLVADPDTVWLGMEFFCSEGDGLWSMPDDRLADFAVSELAVIGIADADAVLDRVVVRVPKTYPAYFGSYDCFETIRRYADGFSNLYLLGRNGMHRYNNQDHSMLTAMVAVDNILAGDPSKEKIWAVNAEAEYHEQK